MCFLDADGSLDPAELVPLVAAVEAGAQLAVGRRVPVTRGVWPWHARAGNLVLATILRRRGLPVSDIACTRAVRRADLLALGRARPRVRLPAGTAGAGGRRGLDGVEHDVAYRPRAAGTRSKVSGSVRGTLRAVRDMAGVLR